MFCGEVKLLNGSPLAKGVGCGFGRSGLAFRGVEVAQTEEDADTDAKAADIADSRSEGRS